MLLLRNEFYAFSEQLSERMSALEQATQDLKTLPFGKSIDIAGIQLPESYGMAAGKSKVSVATVVEDLSVLREQHAKHAENIEQVLSSQSRQSDHLEHIREMQDKHIEIVAGDVLVLAKKAGISQDDLGITEHAPECMRSSSNSGSVEHLKACVAELIQGALEEAVTYQLQETVWDAAILIGMPLSLGVFDSLILGFAVFMQCVIQTLLCVIVIDLESENTRGVREARHSVDCLGRLGEFQAFMEGGLGPMLSCLMIMTWTMCVLKEFRHVGDFVMAVWNLPRTNHTRLDVHERTGRIMILQISCWRLALVTISGALQFTIASTLLVLGSMWLASTVVLTDLLLNGVALQFIMEIDELVFHVFCSAKIKTITLGLHPLQLPKRLVLPRSVSVRALASLLTWILFFVVILSTFLKPNFDEMNSLIEVGCSADDIATGG